MRQLDWGQVVQCLLRVMDCAPNGQSSRDLAEKMANAIIELSQRGAVETD